MRWLRAIPIVVVSAAVIFICGELVASAINITTKLVTVPAVVTLTQGDYRWYENVNSLTPVTALATEDQEITTPSAGSVLRLRMNIQDTQLQLASGATFKLQYANSTSSGWMDVGTSTAWVFFDNPGVADGQIIVDTLLSSSNVGESYDESNPSAATPNNILPGQRGEWDWVLANNSADTQSNWFFRMVYASGTALDAYLNFPALAAAPPPPPPPPPPSGGGGRAVGVGGGQIAFPPPGNETTTPATPCPSIPPPLLPPSVQMVDLNCDNRVDIIDLSILLYYYNQSGPQIARYDFNHDLSVDFPDVSIMMFYWTS